MYELRAGHGRGGDKLANSWAGAIAWKGPLGVQQLVAHLAINMSSLDVTIGVPYSHGQPSSE